MLACFEIIRKVILQVALSVGHEFTPQDDLDVKPPLPSYQSLFAWGSAWLRD